MNVYEARHKGREYCNNTEGSAHYKGGGVEPIDLMIAKGVCEGFCIGNMLKYATRFKETRNLDDLKKVSDYAHILCGVELGKAAETNLWADGEPIADQTTTEEGQRIIAENRRKFYCADREMHSKNHCHECPLGNIANAEYLSCDQFTRFHSDIALEIMRKAVE